MIGMASVFAQTGNAKTSTITDPAIRENDFTLPVGSHVPNNKKNIPSPGIMNIWYRENNAHSGFFRKRMSGTSPSEQGRASTIRSVNIFDRNREFYSIQVEALRPVYDEGRSSLPVLRRMENCWKTWPRRTRTGTKVRLTGVHATLMECAIIKPWISSKARRVCGQERA